MPIQAFCILVVITFIIHFTQNTVLKFESVSLILGRIIGDNFVPFYNATNLFNRICMIFVRFIHFIRIGLLRDFIAGNCYFIIPASYPVTKFLRTREPTCPARFFRNQLWP